MLKAFQRGSWLLRDRNSCLRTNSKWCPTHSVRYASDTVARDNDNVPRNVKQSSNQAQQSVWDNQKIVSDKRRSTSYADIARFTQVQENYRAPRESVKAVRRSVDLFFENDLVIPTVKPPTKQWYTGNIMVNELSDVLEQARKQTRHYLHSQKVLASINSSVNQNSQFRKQNQAPVRYLPREALIELLGGDTRMKNTEYRQIIDKLRDISNLIPLTVATEAMTQNQTTSWPLLVTDPIGLIEARLAGAVHSGGIVRNFLASPETRLSQQLSLILSFFTRTSSIALNDQKQNVSSNPGGILSTAASQGLHRPTGHRDGQGRMRAHGGRKSCKAFVWLVPTQREKTNLENAGLPDQQGPYAVSPSMESAQNFVVESIGESPEDREARLAKKHFFVTDKKDSAIGQILVNGKLINEYFSSERYSTYAHRPFSLLNLQGDYNVFALVRGGGPMAQAQAISNAIARALSQIEWENIGQLGMMNRDLPWRQSLKKANLLLRDPRSVERKKTGQPKARKKKTWVKR